VRADPPSLEEQQQDVLRQIQIKQLAQLADMRWASKPSYLDKPQTKQPRPATRTSDATLNPPMGAVGEGPKTHNAVSGAEATKATGTMTPTPTPDVTPTAKEDPWAKARASDSENWQPESWTPSSSRR
jgi:NADH dehydrogenase [ubiquinone] 1 alpha subcomplex assembly factor 2